MIKKEPPKPQKPNEIGLAEPQGLGEVGSETFAEMAADVYNSALHMPEGSHEKARAALNDFVRLNIMAGVVPKG